MPLARQVVLDLAVEHGACIRPVQLRRTNLDTGDIDQVLVPCGHTLASVCPSCAERARSLRAAQCREGWHLEDEPDITPSPASEDQEWWVVLRAEAQQQRDAAAAAGTDTTDFDLLITELDEEIANAGIRGKVNPDRPDRRHRSTRRRQDAPDLPHRKVTPRTVGKTYTAPDGKTFRPSMFVTLTCPSYGRVGEDGAPADPAAYEYDRAARDALAFAALFDRFMQNLRRYLGYDVQYFAVIEPQKRLAPHVHIAIRGTVPRAELRRVLAATYHQVWWPSTTTVKYDGDELPVWDEATGNYLDPATGEVLPTWDQALDAIGQDDEPWLRGPSSGTGSTPRACWIRDARTPDGIDIGYLTKYLTKQVSDCHQAQTDSQRVHAVRLAEALRLQPCSPRCANWLRYWHPARGTPGPAWPPAGTSGKCPRRATTSAHAGRCRVAWCSTQMVRQDPRPTVPLRPERVAVSTLGVFGNRPGPVCLGTRRTHRPRPHGAHTTAPCTPSLTVPDGKPHSTRPGAEHRKTPSNFSATVRGRVHGATVLSSQGCSLRFLA